eukprot:jgi/Bigna1/70018/fgenesh1_pg.10_\
MSVAGAKRTAADMLQAGFVPAQIPNPNKFHRQHHKLQQQQQQQDRLEYPRQFRSFHDQHQQHQQQQHQQNRDNDCFNALTEVFQSLEKRLMDTEDDKASVHRYMTYISRHNPRDVLERVFEIEEAQQRLRQQADCEISRMIRLGILDTGERPVPNWKKRGQNDVQKHAYRIAKQIKECIGSLSCLIFVRMTQR